MVGRTEEALTATPSDFLRVRGCRADEQWAERALRALVSRGQVDEKVAEVALGEVLALVRQSGEGPPELHGEPEQWARERLDAWLQEGLDVVRDDAIRWRELPQGAAGLGAGISLLLGLLAVLKGEWTIAWTVGLILLPLGVAAVVLATLLAWERAVAWHSRAMAAVSAVLTALVGAGLVMALHGLTTTLALARASVLWWLPLAAAHAGLALALGRLTSKHGTSTGSMTDAEWTAELGRILHSRGAMTQDQLGGVVAEAQDHARSAGTSLVAEFGSPAAHATRICPRPLVRARRSALARLGFLAVAGWGLADLLTDHMSREGDLLLWAGLGCLALASVQMLWRYGRFLRQPEATDDAKPNHLH